ncbi:hypothetical protein RHGRI_005069 [Rhododendron griersonianum]|uniref:Uncharacterized protein n=1 Tax=Rhododendron griersonianum TaxID=479676 RepID=A0AAV6LB59_9ERIC|nr:hypothetical protein RHGRI_005069 [Rhododendron griersonianum]
MVDYPQGLPYEFWKRETERVEMSIFFRSLRLWLFSFILICVLLSLRMPPWFGLNVSLSTLWKWILILVVALAAIIQEYENQWHKTFYEGR